MNTVKPEENAQNELAGMDQSKKLQSHDSAADMVLRRK
jgi:hypothetical protein